MATHIRSSYAFIAALVMFSSCSQEDSELTTGRRPGGRIEFKATLPGISSRATAITVDKLTDFQVSAFTVGESPDTAYFKNKIFSRDNATGTFVCNDKECVWPNNSNNLRFIAFYPSCTLIGQAGGNAVLSADSIEGFKVPLDIASQFDFVSAITSGNLYDNEETGISISFQHQLSRIFLKAWGNSESYDIEIAGVRIGGVGTGATFSLAGQIGTPEADKGGQWKSMTNGYVEYIYRAGDEIVKLDATDDTPNKAEKAVSILGAMIGGESGDQNSAMVIPSDNPAWDYKTAPANGSGNADGKYISVLLRVTDDTPYESKGTLVYPYVDVPGDAESVCLAIDKTDGKTVKTRLYSNGEDYFTDAQKNEKYDLEANNAVVRNYAWAALPVQGDFKPGFVYTYTLDYSSGVGLRAPYDTTPGAPIISDRVLVEVDVTEWQPGTDTPVTVPRR